MPYINPQNRYDVYPQCEPAKSPGELAFQVWVLIQRFFTAGSARYADYAAVLGVLTSLQHELYRRQVAPYEDAAIAREGDVRE